MSHFDDDQYDMDAAWGASADDPTPGMAPGPGDFGHPSPTMTRFLADLHTLGEGPAPEPTAELAALFAGVSSLDAARARRGPLGRHRVGLVIAAVAVSTAGLTGLAAANTQLPQPAQRVVSRVVNDLTPFHVDPSRPPAPTPAPHPSTPAEDSPPTHPDPAGATSSEPRDSESAGAPDGSDTAGDSSPGADRGSAGGASGEDGADSGG